MASREFCDHVLDLLSHIDGISARTMFGGFGLYKGRVMFALIADDVLFYKVGASNRADYEDAGSKPFTYEGKNKPIQMSYWQVPEDVLEDSEDLRDWTMNAYDAALKAKSRQQRRKRVNRRSKAPRL